MRLEFLNPSTKLHFIFLLYFLIPSLVFTQNIDTDGDGIINIIDLDDDNDGLLDEYENNVCLKLGLDIECDIDGDGIPAHLDLDEDNDGIPNVVELNLLDNDKDATLNGIDWLDINNDGVHDLLGGITNPIDTDGDGVPDYLDLDSDNDTIFDTVEYDGFGDIDITGNGLGDGIDIENEIDNDDLDGDGILGIIDRNDDDLDSIDFGSASYLTPLDFDNDGIPNYLDKDSNNDGIYDIETTIYFNLIPNSNGTIIGTNDNDNDGILDNFDTENNIIGSPRNLNGKFSLGFDGRNDFVEEEGDDIVNGLTQATMMAWVKLDSTFSDYGAIMGQNNFWLRINSTRRLRVEINGSPLTAPKATALNLNIWTHIAAVYDGSNVDETVKLFINGEKVDSTNTAEMRPAIKTSTNKKFRLGRAPSNTDIYNTTANMFKGEIDEVRVFNKALSDIEIQRMVYQELDHNNNFNSGLVIPLDISSSLGSNLVRYYKMDFYNDNILNNKVTVNIDSIGAKIYNIKDIYLQTAPLPFQTKSDGNWSNLNTWLYGNVWDIYNESENKDWIIVDVKNNLTTSITHKTLGLFVENGSKLSIENNQGLYNSWYLELDGIIDLVGESQLIQNEGSILDADSGGYIERDQQGTANSFNYNYWTSSVSIMSTTGIGTRGTGVAATNTGYTLEDVMFDGTDSSNPSLITYNSSYTAADSGPTSPITKSSYWLWKFNGANDDYDAWIKIEKSTLLDAGEGFTMKGSSGSTPVTDEQNYVFIGIPNNGDISLPIAAGNDRLLGNPYPSALDVNEFILDNISDSGGRASTNVINGALYFWDHFGEENTHYLSGYVGGYATRNLTAGAPAISNDVRINATNDTGTKIPGQFIPVNQGFFVIGVSSDTIRFKNRQRFFVKESPDRSVFMKNSKLKKNKKYNTLENDKRPKIRLLYQSPMGYHRQIVIGSDARATNNFELGYDAEMIDVNEEDMFWLIDEIEYVIQGVHNFNKEQEFALGVKVKEAGIIKIGIAKLENIDEYKTLYIKDNLTGETYNIKEQPFEIELKAGEYLNRFSLAFQPRLKTLEEVTLNKGIFSYMNNETSEIYVRKIVDTEITNIQLFNYLGQEAQRWTGKYLSREFMLPVNVITGVYILQINTKNGEIIKKMVVN